MPIQDEEKRRKGKRPSAASVPPANPPAPQGAPAPNPQRTAMPDAAGFNPSAMNDSGSGIRALSPAVSNALSGSVKQQGDQLPLTANESVRVARDTGADLSGMLDEQQEGAFAGGFKKSIPGRFVGALKGENPIPGTTGLYEAVNNRAPKISKAIDDGKFVNAAGQAIGMAGEGAARTAWNAADTATSATGAAIGTGIDVAGDLLKGVVGETPNTGSESGGNKQAVSSGGSQAREPGSQTLSSAPAKQQQPTTQRQADSAQNQEKENPQGQVDRQNNIEMTITPDGRKSFSGGGVGEGATINGKPMGFGFNVVSSDGMKRLTGADKLPNQNGVYPGVPVIESPETPAGFRQGQSYRPSNPSDFEERLAQEIYRQATTAHPGSQNGQLTANQLNALRGLRGDIATERTGIDLQAMRNDGMLNQTAMTQQGANQRTQAQLGLDAARLAGEQYERGFNIRNLERMERLRNAYEQAETPEQKSAIAEQLRILNGSSADQKYQLQTIDTPIDPSNPLSETAEIPYVFDPRTGQLRTAVPQNQYVVGQVYPGADGRKARFAGYDENGKPKWEAVKS